MAWRRSGPIPRAVTCRARLRQPARCHWARRRRPPYRPETRAAPIARAFRQRSKRRPTTNTSTRYSLAPSPARTDRRASQRPGRPRPPPAGTRTLATRTSARAALHRSRPSALPPHERRAAARPLAFPRTARLAARSRAKARDGSRELEGLRDADQRRRDNLQTSPTSKLPVPHKLRRENVIPVERRVVRGQGSERLVHLPGFAKTDDRRAERRMTECEANRFLWKRALRPEGSLQQGSSST